MTLKTRSNLTLSHLHVLSVVAACGSFSEAALQLDMAQSGVSNAIAALESQLGVQLFSRGRYGARLTPVGDRILAHAQQMLDLQNEILKEANLTRSLHGGELRITSFRSATTHVVSGALAKFRQQFPQISITLTERDRDDLIEEDLQLGHADVGFVDHRLEDGFESWALLQDEYVVLIPNGLKPDDAPLQWEDVAAFPLVMSAKGDAHDEFVVNHCRAAGVTLNVAYHVGADSSIVSMVAQGLGASIIPRLAAEPIPPHIKVFSLPTPLFRTISVAILADALLSPPVFAFLDLLKDSKQE